MAESDRARKPGGDRKKITVNDLTLLADLDALVDPETRGDPESPLRWTCKSARKLAAALREKGHKISHQAVAELLRQSGFSLRANANILEGSQHEDRDAQFKHINEQAKEFQAQNQPVVSVDGKKKEMIGPFKNGGCEWMPAGEPEAVNVDDVVNLGEGKGFPYGVYDTGNNDAWVSVGCDHDTAAFAVQTLRNWWRARGIESAGIAGQGGLSNQD